MRKPSILICDDNPSVSISLTGYLQAEDMEVLNAQTGEEALEIINNKQIDLIILDIMLPGISGIEVCREIRYSSDVPIIMLYAKGEEIDRIIGLELGADYYVTKPFSTREVVIRVKKLLNRNKNPKNQMPDEITVGNLKIFPDSYEVLCNGEAINVTPREFTLLRYLAENVGRIRSRDQIISEIWGVEFEGESRVADILVNRLRTKLAGDGNRATGVNIATVFGVGYRLQETDEKQKD